METEKLLKPIRETGIGFYAAAGALSVVALWMLAAWLYQLRNGLIVTGLRDWGVGYGAPWGVYIATFVWYIGIAHGGIAISAAIRLLRLEAYKPIARIAEVVTVISLMMAGANITFDIGRPDRIFNMIVNYWSRVGHSPLVWDVTVILIYMVLSISYLVISMRDDIAALRRRLPALFAPLYALVLFGYHPEEREKREQILWWLALALICLMTLLSGGVVPWLFGLMVSQAGWFSALQGPYFLIGALASAIAAIIVVVFLVRRVLGWEKEISAEVFSGLSKPLAVLLIAYLYLVLQEQLTILYAGPPAEQSISHALLFGHFAPLFWMVIGVMAVSVAYLGLQWLGALPPSVGRTAIAAAGVVAALWVKRVLIVVPTFLYPRLPYPTGIYVPTWVEWSLFLGTVALAVLLFMGFSKMFPLMEMEVRR